MSSNSETLPFKAVDLLDEKNTYELREFAYDLKNLSPNSVVIKISYIGIGPYDIKCIAQDLPKQKDQISFGFEGAGIITHVGKDLDSSIIGKQASFMTTSCQIKAFSELTVIPYQNIHVYKDTLDKESFQKAAYLFGNPFTAKGFITDVIDPQKCTSVIMDTANSSLGKMLAKLFKDRNIKLINLVRNEEACNTMKKISEEFINLNTSDPEFNLKLKTAINTNHPSIYVSFLGGNLPTRVFEEMDKNSTLYSLGNMTNNDLNGFSSMPFIFQGKKVKGYTVFSYFSRLLKENKFKEVTEELCKDKNYDTELNTNIVEFSIKEFDEGLKYYKENSGKGKIVFTA